MKRLFGDVTYGSKANEHGWRTKYFTARIVEIDFEAQIKEGSKRGELSPGIKGVLSYMRTHVDVGAWKCKIIENWAGDIRETPEEWLLRRAINHRVYNLEAVKKLCATGSILNVLPEEHQMAYQFYS